MDLKKSTLESFYSNVPNRDVDKNSKQSDKHPRLQGMKNQTSHWIFTFQPSLPITYCGHVPEHKNMKFITEEENITSLEIRIDNPKELTLTSDDASMKANLMASKVANLITVTSGRLLRFSESLMAECKADGKSTRFSKSYTFRWNIETYAFDNMSDDVFEKLLDDDNYDLMTLIEFGSYAIRSSYNNNPTGAIVWAYLATNENCKKTLKHCDVKEIRHLRNLLMHRNRGKISDHKKSIDKVQEVNNVTFETDHEGFFDHKSPANQKIIAGFEKKILQHIKKQILEWTS